MGELLSSQAVQFVIDQREEMVGGLSVTLIDGHQDAGDLSHPLRLT
jgi:hypothetical protein